MLTIGAGACDEPSSTTSTSTSVIATAVATDPPAETVTSETISRPPIIPHNVGDMATPAAGGTIVGEWTGIQLQALGFLTDEVRMGVLADFTLAALTNDGSQILIVGLDGKVVERVRLAGSYNQMLVHAGDLAELFLESGETTWISLRAGERGTVVEPPQRPTVEGAGCFWAVYFEVQPQRWEFAEDRCNMAVHDPIAQPDGSVLLTTASPLDDNVAVEVSSWQLGDDGTIRRVLLGRHAIDGAEGWIKYQPTPTGGVVLYHYGDDAIVLYSYTYPMT